MHMCVCGKFHGQEPTKRVRFKPVRATSHHTTPRVSIYRPSLVSATPHAYTLPNRRDSEHSKAHDRTGSR